MIILPFHNRAINVLILLISYISAASENANFLEATSGKQEKAERKKKKTSNDFAIEGMEIQSYQDTPFHNYLLSARCCAEF